MGKLLDYYNQYHASVEKIRTDVQDPTFRKLIPRTRSDDFTEALSMEVYDPLWLLGRQWQFGRFQGNDCGSTVMTKIMAAKQRVDSVSLGGKYKAFFCDHPLEYDVEKRNHEVDYQVRTESALHYMRMTRLGTDDALFKSLLEMFPLDPVNPTAKDDKDLEDLVVESNDRLQKMARFYGSRLFDGYKLYLHSFKKQTASGKKGKQAVEIPDLSKYQKWFQNKYLPLEDGTENCWNPEKLGYEVKMTVQSQVFAAEDYHTGRLSWYSFDAAPFDLEGVPAEYLDVKNLTYIPTRATFPGAPDPHLWAFEDAKVNYSNYSNKDFSQIASAVMVKFLTMYTGDWQIVPLEVETGHLMSIMDITVRDSFGEEFHIANTPESVDGKKASVGFENRWAMFSTVSSQAYSQKNFATRPGLLFPPTLNQTVEGAPIEEVQFLRDEMANMMWGVETRVSDGCGGSMDGRTLSDKVLGLVDLDKPFGQKLDGGLLMSRVGDAFGKAGTDLAARIVAEVLDADTNGRVADGSDYSYLFMNRVPINWIPFIPQRMEGSLREIRFRRGRMPIWFNGDYHSVRPMSGLLKVEKDKAGKVVPRFVNEEEILGYGTKVVLNAQRTRWYDGSIFTWRGYTKKISGYQANSGLMFDKLLDNSDTKKVVLNANGTKKQ